MPAEVVSAAQVISELERVDAALCAPDAAIDGLIAAVARLDTSIRASAPSWSTTDGHSVLQRFNAVLALAVERRATLLSAIEHQTSGRRAIARYQGR